MECTQRLECTQDLYESRCERICPEQIGFLGICGERHPVKRGPNKIGRDPQTCSIVLNLNSISRQHAVINVLNEKEYMLMDLDSANKTKLMDKTIPPYIPHPIKNGDMVQFGDIFGVFRLLEEDTDLPMTQAIDMPETQIPETPIPKRHMSKMNNIPITTIPESPDVSDKDDSFIVPSQPKCFRNSNSHFVKPSAKLIAIQPIGTNKIDNIYWNSSKKSISLNSQHNDSVSNLNDSSFSDKTTTRLSSDKSIYEMETQPPVPCEADDSTDSIYTANTQVPPATHTADTQAPSLIHTANTQVSTSIYNADTQAPTSIHNASTQVLDSIHTESTQAPCASSSIHSVNTQLPPSTNLPEVCRIDNQLDMQFNLNTSSKNHHKDNIFQAETQLWSIDDVKLNPVSCKSGHLEIKTSKDKDCHHFNTDIESQTLLPSQNKLDVKNDIKCEKISEHVTTKKNSIVTKTKNEVIIHSDSSTDCEDIDILPTQKITEKKVDDEDLTDCEDLFDDAPMNPIGHSKKSATDTKINNFEDMLTQVITEDIIENHQSNSSVNQTTHDVNFEEMLTQVIIPDDNDKPTTSHIHLEDLPTQIIVADSEDVIIADNPIVLKKTSLEDNNMSTKAIGNKSTQSSVSKDFVSPFKIPLLSPLKAKRKEVNSITSKTKLNKDKVSPVITSDDDNFYASTQDVLNDLCTQPVINDNLDSSNNSDDEFLPSSVEDYKVGSKFPHLENNISPRQKQLNKSFDSVDSNDGDENVNNFVSKLSSEQIRDVIGVEPQIKPVKHLPSDSSDVELTPKKVKPIKFMNVDLPNSQEIKTSVSMFTKTAITESSSDSEQENDSMECTPILFPRKKKSKTDAKRDLTKVFTVEALPTRVITRVRKPASKFQNDDNIKFARNILKPKYLTEQEGEIDSEIIIENISRLKSNRERARNKEAKKNVGQEIKLASKVKDQTKLDEKENAKQLDKVDVDKHCNIDGNSTRKNSETKNDTDTLKTISAVDKSKEKSNKNEQVSKKESTRSRCKADDKKLTVKEEVSKPVFPELKKDSQLTNLKIENSTDAKNTHYTRNRRKVNEKDKRSTVVETESTTDKKGRTSRKQNIKKTVEIDLTDDVVEVRRSRRQKPSNEKNESDEKKDKREIKSPKKADNDTSVKPAARRGRPPKHARTAKAEQSTVFSLSSESGTDSPKSILKRSAPENLDPPSPKRTRSVVNPSASLRATPARMNKPHYILFTAFPCEEVKAKLEKLGAVVVSDVTLCSVVLTLAVKRTFKLLCAVGLGRPIVGPSWVQACVDTNMIVDPWLYILKDDVAEKRFHFSLEKTLTGKRNFLNGFNVSSTPSVLPNKAEMKLIVECSGGTWKEEGPQWICVSCTADKQLWPALKRKGAIVVSTEFILGGVLRQRADITSNKLGYFENIIYREKFLESCFGNNHLVKNMINYNYIEFGNNMSHRLKAKQSSLS